MGLEHVRRRFKKACLEWQEAIDDIEIILATYDDEPNRYRIKMICEKLCRTCEVIAECGKKPSFVNALKAFMFVQIADFHFRKLKRLGFFDKADTTDR